MAFHKGRSRLVFETRNGISNDAKKDSPAMTVSLDPEPKGELKILGGSRSDDYWNLRLSNLVVGALPIRQSNSEAVIFASQAVCQATMDIAPADPIEGILIGQLMAANEAASRSTERAGRT
jgi:hypothetical protein